MIGSLYSIIITFELRSSISAQDIYAQSQKFSALYGHSSGSKALDNLQQYYMCCGGNSNFKAINFLKYLLKNHTYGYSMKNQIRSNM